MLHKRKKRARVLHFWAHTSVYSLHHVLINKKKKKKKKSLSHSRVITLWKSILVQKKWWEVAEYFELRQYLRAIRKGDGAKSINSFK